MGFILNRNHWCAYVGYRQDAGMLHVQLYFLTRHCFQVEMIHLLYDEPLCMTDPAEDVHLFSLGCPVLHSHSPEFPVMSAADVICILRFALQGHKC